MPELESVIEKRLIDTLCTGESQWRYREDIRNEDQLWENFKYILEQNNKAILNDTPLSETEFAKVKNDVSHASFYDAGKWLVGEQGKVYVHVQRGNEVLHLVVLNSEHIGGGSSTYEIINQYQAFKDEEVDGSRNRRFDVTLLINGIPMIHIELKNRDHSYIEGFNQIKKYVSEGKFRGLFSNIQMFVVSNAVDTKYFAPARDTELNKKFLSKWVDEENNPVTDYIDFAESVLKIPQAHEIVTKYTVLDNDKQKLVILRPYQIHAIEAMRKASKKGISGYIWHTTGSGKTLTSYKSARNLLMDIPSIDKTIFLIDRKDLDTQTTMDFQSYANNDTIDVDETDNVSMLIRRLSNGSRQMIVTTRQKMQIMIKRLSVGTPRYEKIRSLKIAFVVDECHRAVSPETKRTLERFFHNSLWYGYTGTPIFEENAYEQRGDLPQTTEQLYGKCLHSYTIKEAIRDEAVLGFMVENLGPRDREGDIAVYTTEQHMRGVLEVILNKSASKFGLQNGRGRTYEAILTTSSIAMAQKYYDLLKKIKNGEDSLKISDDITRSLPDFPRFAITYSLSENTEVSQLNQGKMKVALKDYNEMFGTDYKIEEIGAYNGNLNKRLARKDKKYLVREQQLDLVIVVDRLLTGFDAPCLSTVFIDRQPMKPQDIIQTLSRTNRLFDVGKQYGQIVTFQSHDDFKKKIDDALKMYSLGGDGQPLSEDWEEVKEKFTISLRALKGLATTYSDVSSLSKQQKKAFIYLFRDLDKNLSHLRGFSIYSSDVLEALGFSEEEYENYAAAYKNVLAEMEQPAAGGGDDEAPIYDDYELVARSTFRVDYEYIISLIQGFVTMIEQSEQAYSEEDFYRNIAIIRTVIDEFEKGNPKMAKLLHEVVDGIEKEKEKYFGVDISVMVNQMRYEAVDSEVKEFASRWFLPEADVRYEVYHYKDGVIANENILKEKADYAAYKETAESPVPKFKFRSMMIDAFRNGLMSEVLELL